MKVLYPGVRWMVQGSLIVLLLFYCTNAWHEALDQVLLEQKSRLLEADPDPSTSIASGVLGYRLSVDDGNRVLWVSPTPMSVPRTLSEALPSDIRHRLTYPQDLIAGDYRVVGDYRLLRLSPRPGEHLLHVVSDRQLLIAALPQMALPLTLTLLLVGGSLRLTRLSQQFDRQHQELARHEALFRHSSVPQLLVDVQADQIVQANRAASRLFGFPRRTLLEIPFRHLCRPTPTGGLESSFGGTLMQARLAGNRTLLVDVIPSVPSDRQTPLQQYFILNASGLNERAEDIRQQAYHDALTHLPNRNFLFEHLQKLLATHRREERRFAVLFVDLDRFKQVNDGLGHDVGDRILLTVGERLKSRLRESDLLARLGGDEFTIVLPHLRDDLDASLVARSVVKHLSEPFIINGYDIRIGASVGIAIYPDNGDNAQTLLKNADIAMYQAKEVGRGGYCFFDEHMNQSLTRRSRLEQDIGQALERGELRLLLQPIVDLHRLEIAGAEALLRWEHPTLGTLLPGDFIPVAEETGHIATISEWVLRTSLELASDWLRRSSRPDLFLSLNLSQRQLINLPHVRRWQEIIEASPLPPRNLLLELNEGLYRQGAEELGRTLYQLHQTGVRLALDHFGGGLAPLSLLRQVPVGAIKINVANFDLPDETPAARFDEGLIRLGLTMGVTVIAVGVESANQVRRLRQAGCHYAQGYLFSEPRPPEAFFEQLTRPYALVGLEPEAVVN